MKKQDYTGNLIGTDVSRVERTAFLRKLPKPEKTTGSRNRTRRHGKPGLGP